MATAGRLELVVNTKYNSSPHSSHRENSNLTDQVNQEITAITTRISWQ